MKKKIIPLVILAGVITGSVYYFDILKKGHSTEAGVEGSGTVEVTEIQISSKIAGRITSVPFEEGEAVEKGAIVARISASELSAQMIAASSNLTNSQKNFYRSDELYKSGSLSKQGYDNALNAFSNARSQIELLSAQIENTITVSPLSGIVLERVLEPGEMAFPGSTIVTVADLKKVWLKIYVRETDLGKVKIGNKARIFIDSYPDKPFPGKVSAISNKAEFTPKTIQTKDERVKLVYAVKITADNPEMVLKPGMPADAVIETGK
jgi:HlyD family secretion protein